MTRLSVVAAALLAAVMATAQEKIAVVNMIDLVRFHPHRERDRKLMQDTEREFQERLDRQRDQFEQLRGDYEKAIKEARNPALNDKARAEAEDTAMRHRDVLAEADRDLRQEMQKLQRELGDLDARLLRQVTGDLRERISAFASEGKHSIILDGTTLAYFDPKLDVTDEVLRRMGVDPKVRQEAESKEGAAAPGVAAQP